MFKGKTLVGVGCSHVFGSFLDENMYIHKETCHLRSWLKKLEILTQATNSINLAHPGASNKRSYRVIRDFVLKNQDILNDLVIFLGITEPIRTELPIAKKVTNSNVFGYTIDSTVVNEEYDILTLGSFLLGDQHERDQSFKKFLDLYYGYHSFVSYEVEQMNLDLISLHTFFSYFGVEHHFLCMLVNEQDFSTNSMKEKLPIISFDSADAIYYAKLNGHKVGTDYDPNSGCNHLDDEGNMFIAKYIKETLENNGL